MRDTRLLMGMPITVEVVDASDSGILEGVYAYFRYIDETFSTYKDTSEIMKINRGELDPSRASEDMKTVLALSEETKRLTDGYFDIKKPDGSLDPSGLVKGWAIWKAAQLLDMKGYKQFFVDAGGDIETRGRNADGRPWRIGIRNPFNVRETVKTIEVGNKGVATSGTYERGNHIYNPKTGKTAPSDVVSLTVIGPNVYEADRFATAAFAMGKKGIEFIESLEGFQGYQIDATGQALMTTGFETYVPAYV